MNRYLKYRVFLICLASAILPPVHLCSQGQVKKPDVKWQFEKEYNPISVSPIAIGQKVPEIVFQKVLNHKATKLKLSSLKGKLVILDFWSTYCASCIAGFPKMEELQNAFGDKIQILLVNANKPKYDSESRVQGLLNKYKARTGYYPSMPIPIHDTILNSYFPHQSVPHQVWIDGSGELVAVTGFREVNHENIQAILDGKNISLPVKNDWAFDREKPLYLEGNGGNDQNFFYRAILSNYNGSLGSSQGGRYNDKGEIVGAYILNKSLIGMVREAYMDIFSRFDKSREILEVRNPARYSEEFDAKNTYCYDVTVPATTIDFFSFTEFLKDDLKRLFGISVQVGKRKIKCILVRSTAEIEKIYTKGATQDIDVSTKTIRKFIRNYPIGEVIQSVQPYFMKPLIDETGLTAQKIDIDFPESLDFSNPDSVMQCLMKMGFRFEIAERDIDVVIISENKN